MAIDQSTIDEAYIEAMSDIEQTLFEWDMEFNRPEVEKLIRVEVAKVPLEARRLIQELDPSTREIFDEYG